MLDASTYVRIILKKRGMTQNDLVRAMQDKGIKSVYKTHISEALNIKMSPVMARKIEIGLDLPKYSLVKIVGMPVTRAGIQEIERIGN
jgi:arginine repressor